jgi:tRNA threonylcarbamoyladenosine biosynthesis protein TsaE
MPILDAHTFEFISRSPDQTRRIGIRLGMLLGERDVICLCGDLGAGKTTLVQGIAKGWGSTNDATSPSFVLVNNYRRPDGAELNHLDAYRLESATDAEDLDIELMLGEGSLVVEWPERILEALPSEYLWIDMVWLAEEQRSMVFRCAGARYERLLAHLKESMVQGLI